MCGTPARSPKDEQALEPRNRREQEEPGPHRCPLPPALIIFHREMSNYKGIQDRSANRVEKVDDLKIFNYLEKG